MSAQWKIQGQRENPFIVSANIRDNLEKKIRIKTEKSSKWDSWQLDSNLRTTRSRKLIQPQSNHLNDKIWGSDFWTKGGKGDALDGKYKENENGRHLCRTADLHRTHCKLIKRRQWRWMESAANNQDHGGENWSRQKRRTGKSSTLN